MARSSLTPAQRSALETWAESSRAVVASMRGAGETYRVIDRVLLEQASRELSPGPLPGGGQFSELPRRSVNLARARNTKSGSSALETAHLHLRSVQGPIEWTTVGGHLILEPNGAASVLVAEAGDNWHTDAPLWLVENQTLFDRLNWHHGPPSTVGLYSGHLSRALLAWLSCRSRAPAVIHFPDYDGIGLQNYSRLKAACPGAELFVPDDFERLLMAYGNRALFKRTHKQLMNSLSAIDGDAVASRAISLMLANGLALEQEAIFLECSSPGG